MIPAESAALEGFRAIYGRPPEHLARAPGRVNVVGEHIDYCGLGVLPMALQRAVWVASARSPDDRVAVATSAAGLAPATFHVSDAVPPGPSADWSNYARAASQTMASEYRCRRGFDAFVSSDVPIAAGLSSSSALVVATALACLAANDLQVDDRYGLAERLARGERYVGTAGGGMDQASSLLGVAGAALAMTFDPLSVSAVPLPERWRIVVAHSGKAAEKSGDAQAAYNRLTRDAAEAADTLAGADGRTATGLAGYRQLIFEARPADLLETAEARLEDGPLRMLRHVVTEADRVSRVVEALQADDIGAAGVALDGSHRSLSQELFVSTPALDELVDRLRSAGASGARLTGAGMGGCAIALCDRDSVDEVLAAAARFESEREGPRIAFVAEPSGGATVVDL